VLKDSRRKVKSVTNWVIISSTKYKTNSIGNEKTKF